MNSYSEPGNRGATITPSARRSIRDYNESNMVRYGLNTSKERNDKQPRDEVDNIMSKPIPSASPLSKRNKKKINRTNSYSNETEHTDDDDSEGIDFEESNYSAVSCLKSFEDSHHSQLSNRSHQSDLQQRLPYLADISTSSPPKSFTNTDRLQPKSGKSQIYAVMVGAIVGIIAVIYIKQPSILQSLQHTSSHKSTQTVNNDKILFENAMNDLQRKYNVDQDTILKLTTGILTIFSRMDTGSFMIVYNSNTNSFDPSHFEQFINEVASTAAKYLRNNISSIKQTVILSSNLDMQEHGELIDRYRDDVDKTGVLLVKEVDRVPSDLAMAFHYYCDEYNPLVKRSAIFFTLNLANCSNASDKETTHAFIENCLTRKWTTVPSQNIRPLLARVIDIVIDVTHVF